jgi:hypothetical protein
MENIFVALATPVSLVILVFVGMVKNKRELKRKTKHK